MAVGEEFRAFRSNYNIGMAQMILIGARYREITRRLNKDFWNTDSETAHSLYVGSYGRDTAAQGLSDLDIGFRLPSDVYAKYNAYLFNGQSALLQAVRQSLLARYPSTRVGGDGQVVVVEFADGMKFEVLPYFDSSNSGPWLYPDSNGGGSWKICSPKSEIAALQVRNIEVNGNLKALCRMMRVWRDRNSVPMSGALIDALAYRFIATWSYKTQSFSFHDYMVRDFLKYLSEEDSGQQYWLMPGSLARVYKKGAFGAKARTDLIFAEEACLLQNDAYTSRRRSKWRTVFGPTFPA